MSEMKSRRELGLIITGGVIAAGVVAGAKPAAAQRRQVNMERARDALREALEALRAATDDKGGHKAKAMDLIQGAIAEVDAGMRYAETH